MMKKSKKLYRRIKEVTVKKRFLFFFLFVATILDKERGTPAWPRLINKEKVGKTSIYNEIPSSPSLLDIKILINIPKNFVIQPPINKIKVDLINCFLIVKNMKKNKKICKLLQKYDIVK